MTVFIIVVNRYINTRLSFGRDFDSSVDVALKRGFLKYLLRNTIYFAQAFKILICFIFRRKNKYSTRLSSTELVFWIPKIN